MLWMQAKIGLNGLVSLDEFIPIFHTVLFWCTKTFQVVLVHEDISNLIRTELIKDHPAKLLKCCQILDCNNTGFLRPNQIVTAIRNCDLGLTLFQIILITGEGKLAQGQENTCTIEYQPFIANEAVSILTKLITEDTIPVPEEEALTKEQFANTTKLAEESLGMQTEEFLQILNSAFVEADMGNTGHLPSNKLLEALRNSDLRFAGRQEVTFLAMCEDDPSGEALYHGLANKVVEIIMWEARLELIYDLKEPEASAKLQP